MNQTKSGQFVTEIYILQKTSKIVQRTFLLRRLLLLRLHAHASKLVLYLVHCSLVRVHIVVHVLVHICLLIKLVEASHLVETSHLHLWLRKVLLLLHLGHWVHAHGRHH